VLPLVLAVIMANKSHYVVNNDADLCYFSPNFKYIIVNRVFIMIFISGKRLLFEKAFSGIKE